MMLVLGWSLGVLMTFSATEYYRAKERRDLHGRCAGCGHHIASLWSSELAVASMTEKIPGTEMTMTSNYHPDCFPDFEPDA